MSNTMTSDTRQQTETAGSVTYRPAVHDDAYTLFTIFEHSLADLSLRLGFRTPTSAASDAAMMHMWEERRSLYEHLAQTADQSWVAEQDGRAIGFSRAIVRDGVQELTELFVLPGTQSAGIGRELLQRAFPPGNSRHRTIIASPDIRAQVLYLKAGVTPRFQIYYFGRQPEVRSWLSDLSFSPISADPDTLDTLGELDAQILGYRRDVDHRWWVNNRDGWLYLRNGVPVGYGYTGRRNGPFLLLDDRDYAAVLAHAEMLAARAGHREFGLEVPIINRAAVDVLLDRKFRMDPFLATMMTDKPLGAFENYIFFSPPFFT